MKIIIGGGLQESTSKTVYEKGQRVACFWSAKEGWYTGTVAGITSKGIRVKYDDGTFDTEPPGRRTVVIQSKRTNRKALTTEQVHALKGTPETKRVPRAAKPEAKPARTPRAAKPAPEVKTRTPRAKAEPVKAAPAEKPERKPRLITKDTPVASGKKITVDDFGAMLQLSRDYPPTVKKTISVKTGKKVTTNGYTHEEYKDVPCEGHSTSYNNISKALKLVRSQKEWEEVPVRNSATTSKAHRFLFKNSSGQYITINNRLNPKRGSGTTVGKGGNVTFYPKSLPQGVLDELMVSKEEQQKTEDARKEKRVQKKAYEVAHKERAKDWTKIKDHHLDSIKTKLTDASSADIRNGIFHAITKESHFLESFNDIISAKGKSHRFTNSMGSTILTEHSADAKANVIEGLEAIAKKTGLTAVTKGNTITLKSSKGEMSYNVMAAGFGNRAERGYVRLEPV